MATSLAQLAELQKRQPVYPAVLTSLNDMAKMLESQGRYDEAKPIFIEALAVVKRELPGQHMELAHALHNLATVCNAQGRTGEAEPLFIEALSRMKKAPGINDANIARCLNNLLAVRARRQSGRGVRLVVSVAKKYWSILLACLLRYGEQNTFLTVSPPHVHMRTCTRRFLEQALLRESQGNSDKAEKMHKEALETMYVSW